MTNRWLAVAAALIAAYGAGLYYEMTFAPAGCCALTAPSSDPIQAVRLLDQIDPKGLDARAQKTAADAILGARPGDPVGWLNLAYADRLAHGALTPAGDRDIATSYLLVPYAGAKTPWRIAFALNNWTRLTPATRRDVLQEIGLVLTDDALVKPTRAAVTAGVRDPSGRLAAALLGLIQPNTGV